MKKAVLSVILFLVNTVIFAQRNYTALVNPFIGTGGHGHTYPGASMPFGMMQLSPDTRGADWDGSSGYHYSDSVIYGFSHTHLSGTGIPDYCDILFMPFSGEVNWDSKNYRSGFSHAEEKASPGYYEVLLNKNNIKAQLTTSVRSGMHQYTFPATANEGSVLIDLKWRDEVLDAFIEKVDDHSIRGYRWSKSWANDQIVYFYAEFEQPINKMVVASDDKETNASKAEGKNIKAALTFSLPAGKKLQCRIGISGVSMDGAKGNLKAEIAGWSFDKVRNDATAAWNKELSKIDISGGTKDQQTVFYTALYHTFIVPNIYQDIDGQFRGTDRKIHTAKDFTNYTVFSLWDTYRAYHPLMTIINRKRTNDWINTFLAQYKYGGMLPVWELSGNETFCMIGYHSVPVIADAFRKGIRGFDTKLALDAMQSYSQSNRFGLDHYRNNGYLSNDKEHESVSKTLEYAYDDWCISNFAKSQGQDSTYKQYIERAQFYKNVFDPSTHNMRGKVQSMWHSPFEPREINNFFTEGNAWQYSFAAPQDIETLIKLHGGKEAFSKKLDELFTTSSQTSGRDQPDVTGLIGQYAQGNEPSHHMAYLFNYVGQPWRTEELISKICKEFYTNAPDGLIGNEDCGQMSAWYVLSAMGFYPACPGSDEYVLGTPVFEKVRINLENGKVFGIGGSKVQSSKVQGSKVEGSGDFYVHSTTFNGRPYDKSYLLHSDIMKGGSFNFSLGATANKKWGSAAASMPHSIVTENPITPVPFFDVKTNKFKDSVIVGIKDIDPTATIWYYVSKGEQPTQFLKNQGQPIVVDTTVNIFSYAEKNGVKSKTVKQLFYRLPGNMTITVLSKVHTMYTAGGPEALIDGIEGTTNWKSGEWQSYFDQDFEAVVDLQKLKQVNHLGVHVLQDVSPWIVYPKEVIFYTSEDGTNFSEAARVKNTVEAKAMEAQVQELGTNVNLKARYIKVKAVNGGKLPAWHESAGNGSHLFIDEVIIK